MPTMCPAHRTGQIAAPGAVFLENGTATASPRRCSVIPHIPDRGEPGLRVVHRGRPEFLVAGDVRDDVLNRRHAQDRAAEDEDAASVDPNAVVGGLGQVEFFAGVPFGAVMDVGLFEPDARLVDLHEAAEVKDATLGVQNHVAAD